MKLPAHKTKIVCTIGPASTEGERKAVQALADLPAHFRTGAGSGNYRVEDLFSLNTAESANALNVRYILAHTQSKGAASSPDSSRTAGYFPLAAMKEQIIFWPCLTGFILFALRTAQMPFPMWLYAF
jgi:hypothetical protein